MTENSSALSVTKKSSEINGASSQSHTNEVHVLFDGYSRFDPRDSKIFITNCTCTLIKASNGLNIIVDTMTPWDGPKIIEALKTHSLRPDDISIVVSTHGHSDHVGNNNLFLNAKWHIVGQSIMHKDEFLIHEPWTPFALTPDIKVIDTRGHTLSCVSVVVENSQYGTVVISGDLFEKEDDIKNPDVWINAGSEDEEKQNENRLKVANMADWIVPGHGKMFKVTPEIGEELLLTNKRKTVEVN